MASSNASEARTPVATFAIAESETEPDEDGCHVSLESPESDLAHLRDPDAVLVAASRIRVLYTYPLGTCGPTPQEAQAGGWIFEELAPNGVNFTRADIVRVVASRYKRIYAEENETSPTEEAYIPGMFNRRRTAGKYGIWGHMLGDLLLVDVEFDAERGVYVLGIDS